MAQAKSLSRTPIREAVLDIQFVPELETGTLKRFEEKLGSSYASGTELFTGQFSFQLGVDQGTQRSVTELIGYSWTSIDGRFVVQGKKGGLTVSHLPPYGGWETFRNEITKIWSLFVAEHKPLEATRVALRYINQIEIPIEKNSFDDILTSAPQVPKGLPQVLLTFFTRSQIADIPENVVTYVSQSFEGITPEMKESGRWSVLLDIDSISVSRISLDTSAALFERIEKLRGIKNAMFFGHVTEYTLELYS